MKQLPLVSIIIPAYKESFFREALNSALSQDYPSLEIVIGDDSLSGVIGHEVSSASLKTTIPIRYSKNTPGLGELKNLESLIRQAHGEYIKILYDDDVIEPTCTSALVNAIEIPGVILATSRRRRINEVGETLDDILATIPPVAEDAILNGNDIVSFACDNSFNFIGEPSIILCRRESLLTLMDASDGLVLLNGYEMTYFGDVSIYMKMLQKGHLAYLVQPLSAFRLSSEQSTNDALGTPEIVQRTYTNFPRAIKELGWYAPIVPDNSAIVRKANLNTPNEWHHYDLKKGFELGKKTVALSSWLTPRKLTPVQLAHLTDRMDRQTSSLTLGVLICGDKEDDIESTVSSLNYFQHAKFQLLPIRIAETQPDKRVAQLNQSIHATQADWFICLQAGDLLLTSGLIALANTLQDIGDVLAIYGDEIIRESGFAHQAAFRPDFNLDFFLSAPGGMSRYWLIKKEALVALDGYRAAVFPAHEFDFAARLIEGAGLNAVHHMHEPLVNALHAPVASVAEQQVIAEHLHRRGYSNAQIVVLGDGKYRIWYGHEAQPLVTIIIPTKDQLQILMTCVTSLMEKTNYKNYEILIVDNGSETPEAQAWLKGIDDLHSSQLRVLRYPHPFNYSAINNFAAKHAQGEYLVLLNNDTAIIDGHWLDAMLNHGLRPEVGIVGAKLLYPDGMIQHAGVILGLRGPAEHQFNGVAPSQNGYMQRLQVDQNYSVVTAACLLVRKSVYFNVDGLNETDFKVSYNDVDFCLKVHQQGHLIVWTPHAVVMHEGSVSQHNLDKNKQQQKIERFQTEQNTFLQKWMPITVNDPAYNQNLALSGNGFELQTRSELSWHPLPWRPLPVIMTWQGDDRLSAQSRMSKPLAAMKNAGMVEGINVDAVLHLTEVARYRPDSLVIQKQFSAPFEIWSSKLGKVTNIFKVFELDENVTRLPLARQSAKPSVGDMTKALRASLSHMDRVVVTTEALADVIRTMHSDIVVQKTLLTAEWSTLQSLKQQSHKPRVGINAFGLQATDLALITELIREFSEKVEWIYFGHCSARLKPWLTEHYPAIEQTWFPYKLAGLNLDLALAPLEGTAFNVGKDATRLMEYGACAVPVICSDVESYRGDIPVNRVNNRLGAWRDALLQHLSDRPACQVQGELLKAYTLQNGIMNEQTLERWKQAWLPS